MCCYGNFNSATCISTGEKWPGDEVRAADTGGCVANVLLTCRVYQVPIDEVRAAVMSGQEACEAMNAKYGGLVKPDISFFGERLPGVALVAPAWGVAAEGCVALEAPVWGLAAERIAAALACGGALV